MKPAPPVTKIVFSEESCEGTSSRSHARFLKASLSENGGGSRILKMPLAKTRDLKKCLESR